MAKFEIASLSGLFGLTTQELHNRLSALSPLLEQNGITIQNHELEIVDEYGLRLLSCLNQLMDEDMEPVEVGRAAHLVVGRE